MTSSERRKPAKLGDAVEGFLENSGLKSRVEQSSVVPEWKKLVGPQIAAATEPVLITRDSVLLVAVSSSSWMSELSLMEPHLLAAINKRAGERQIKKIRFRLMR